MWPRRDLLLTAATAATALHVLDDATLHREPGTTIADHVTGAGATLAVLAVAAVVFTRLRAGAKATLALLLGLFAVTLGGLHVAEIALQGRVAGGDMTGLLAIAAGICALAIGALTLWQSRRRNGSRTRRYGRRALRAAAALVVGVFVVVPVLVAVALTHKPRVVVQAADLGRPHETVTLRTRDGLDLAAWYVPSRNGAAVIAFPGRRQPVPHARMLVRHGYGVLLLGGAATDPRLTAVVSDGAGYRTLHEALEQGGTGTWLAAPQTAVLFGATRVLSPASPPEPLDELVPRIAPRALLLIEAGHGQGGEGLNGLYYRRAGQPKQYWLIPEAHHTGGLAKRPAEYERRVVGFFDRYL